MSLPAQNPDLRSAKVHRGERIRISVNGREIVTYRGETVLAALIAAGYRRLGNRHRSGEGRGAFCGMGLCCECLVSVNGLPNLRACAVEVEEDMEIGIDEPQRI
ncbi:MAG: (2Fe-2S)-binding protein [Proteobacteria bacterium]|nr:(2Fe-2S)-binding protein [Pseudomonadota bacterium]